MAPFSYDIVQLIECVRDRPALWDKTSELYKDRTERRECWEAIFSILEEGYEEMELTERRRVGEQILTKWTNIRDTFMKSLKTRMGRPKRRYVYHDTLKFLLKIVDNNESITPDSDDVSYLKHEEEEPKPTPRKKVKKYVLDDEYTTVMKSGNSSQANDNSLREIDFVECQDTDRISDPRIMNEDEAFFASLLPTVVKFNEDERLEFRIEVLALIKKIKQKRPY